MLRVLAVEETPTVLDDKVSLALNTSNYPTSLVSENFVTTHFIS